MLYLTCRNPFIQRHSRRFSEVSPHIAQKQRVICENCILMRDSHKYTQHHPNPSFPTAKSEFTLPKPRVYPTQTPSLLSPIPQCINIHNKFLPESLGGKEKNTYLCTRIFIVIMIMGTMTKKMEEMQTRRIAYQTRKTKEYMDRVASYLSVADQEILYSGNGFVEVPEEERLRERIDVYPYLIP